MTQPLPVIQMTSSRAVPGTESRALCTTPTADRSTAGGRRSTTAKRPNAINIGAYKHAGANSRLFEVLIGYYPVLAR